MATPDQQAAAARKIIRSRLSGRYSGPRFFFNQTFAGGANASPILPNVIGTDPPLKDIFLIVRLRVVIGTANYTTVAAEAPFTLLNRVLIQGTFAGNNSLVTLIDMSGATLFMMRNLFSIRGNSFYIGSTAAAYTRQAETIVPNQRAGATFGNTGTFDMEWHTQIPMGPFTGAQGHLNAMSFALRKKDWLDGLTMQVFIGDNTAFGTPAGGTTVTYTAFGSASGTPSFSVYLNRLWLGKSNVPGGMADTYPAAVLLRQEKTVPNGQTASVANNTFLFNPTKTRTTRFILKSGLALAASPANTFQTLSDFLYTNVQMLRADQAIKQYQDWFALKEYGGAYIEAIMPGGYAVIDFMEGGNPMAMWRGNEVDGATTITMQCNVSIANANNQLNYVQEQTLGDPQTRLPGTM
jgi:hypothetical protein